MKNIFHKFNTFATKGVEDRAAAVAALNMEAYLDKMSKAIAAVNANMALIKELGDEGKNFHLPSVSPYLKAEPKR
jgi:hypothetical protein